MKNVLAISTLRPRTNTPLSIAPMMDKTDRHFRYFLRQLTKKSLLYTEMINPDAIIFGDKERHLALDEIEHPISLQLGSDDPESLYKAIQLANHYNYDEFNLNVGCPSDRVQNRNIGACLMADPARVRECVSAMRSATTKPVTVKHRIGIKSQAQSLERFEDLVNFIETLYQGPCDGVTIHARIAILEGLSPKENRNIPPIRYGDVYELVKLFPELSVEINGHIKSWEEAFNHLKNGVRAIMIGRASYENPWLLSQADSFCDAIFEKIPDIFSRPSLERKQEIQQAQDEFTNRTHTSALGKGELVRNFARYIDMAQEKWDLNPRSLIWPLLELFNGQKGSRKFRQVLSQPIKKSSSVEKLAETALSFLEL